MVAEAFLLRTQAPNKVAVVMGTSSVYFNSPLACNLALNLGMGSDNGYSDLEE